MKTTDCDTRTPLLVVGLGNVLCGDDGVGLAATICLLAGWAPPPGVQVLDGGTMGLSLLPHLQNARNVVLVDAIDDGSPPGSVVRFEGHQVVRAAASRLSVHQIGVADLLDAVELTGASPERLILLGIVPDTLPLRVGLSSRVSAAVPTLVGAILSEVRALGHPFTPRQGDDESGIETSSRDPLGVLRVGL